MPNNPLDNPAFNDNRRYDYSDERFYVRAEFPMIAGWIPDGSKVIDLGCGNGSLMKYILDKKKEVKIEGIEVSDSGVGFCRKNGMNARIGKIDDSGTYKEYREKEFNYAVCNVTIQMVMFPEVLLQEMSRIANFLIVSFPNFAYIENRFDLLFNGIMPRPMLHGYSWYNTGHIHQLSNKNFENFCKKFSIVILERRHLGALKFFALAGGNLFAKETVYLCK